MLLAALCVPNRAEKGKKHELRLLCLSFMDHCRIQALVEQRASLSARRAKRSPLLSCVDGWEDSRGAAESGPLTTAQLWVARVLRILRIMRALRVVVGVADIAGVASATDIVGIADNADNAGIVGVADVASIASTAGVASAAGVALEMEC